MRRIGRRADESIRPRRRSAQLIRGAEAAGSDPAPGLLCWMRERAHWADSAMRLSSLLASLWRSATTRFARAESGWSRVLPRAMQALRTKPRHFVRLTGLPRNAVRNSSMVRPAIHSSSGASKDFVFSSPMRRGWNGEKEDEGALRFQGQTSWQISHPNTCQPMPSRNSSGIGSLSSMVR